MNEITASEVMSKQALKAILIVITGIMTIILAILMSIAFEFGIVGNLVMSWLLTTAYALFGFFLIDPAVKINPIRVVEKPVIHEVVQVVEKPVLREIQIPMENRIIEVVDRPVIKEVPYPVEVEKRVIRYIERKHRQKKLNIPKFKFIGSTEARTFHKRTCRFSKLIKKKYKAHSNTKMFFKRKHYHACESCIKKKK
jgi:hypothetical protein